MFVGIFSYLYYFVSELAYETVNLINLSFESYGSGAFLSNMDFKLALFGDIPIIESNVYDILLLFFNIFYSMFFIILLYKATKKFISLVFGVFRL